METGAITEHIDVAQVVLYVFWVFFASLILYLRREDKREGYPLENDLSGRITVQGYPDIPAPKTFLLPHGGTYSAPDRKADTRPIKAEPSGNWPGAPLNPTGDPMQDGVGPASYCARADEPEMTHEGGPAIVPMRVAPEFWVEEDDVDPRGMAVFGADKQQAGIVSDLWVDKIEPQIRYLEVEVTAAAGQPKVLLPICFALIDTSKRRIAVQSVHAKHFAGVPRTRSMDRVTKLEEDKITAYFAAGNLYADPSRLEPLL